MQLEIDQVWTFKMFSGEEMVAKVKHLDRDWITLEEPVSIAPGPQGMGLVPSMFTADIKGTIRLNISSVSIYAETDDSIKLKYLEATTGLKIPDKKIVLQG